MRHESMKKNKEAREPKRSLPEKGLGDVVYSGTKAVVGILPFGGTVAELISLVIAPPVQKRWEAWCQGVNDALTALEGKVEAFQIENLKDDPAFTTVFLQATQIAIRNHREEKLLALRNAVLNVAAQSAPDEDRQTVFLGLVDSLSCLHLRLLRFARDRDVTASFLYQAMPELQGRHEFVDSVVRDLVVHTLAKSDTAIDQLPGSTYSLSVTEIGRQFLDFISRPLQLGD